MEEIGLHNYEAWLLDYSEGNLNQQEIATLQTFLLLHPHLDIELGSLELPGLEEELEIFPDASLLEKEFTANEEQVLLYIEGLLPLSEKLAFELRLQQEPALQELLTAYSKTVLFADTAAMPNKDNLFKTEEAPIAWPQSLLYLENNLSTAEITAYTHKLKADAQERAELAAFAATKLQADLTIVHPNKKSLLKTAKVITLFGAREFRYAAAILLLLVFIFLLRLLPNNVQPEIKSSQVANQVPVKETTVPESATNKNAVIESVLAQTKAAVKVASVAVVPEATAVSIQATVTVPSFSPQIQAEAPQMAQRTSAPQSSAPATIQASEQLTTENTMTYASVTDLEIADDFSPLEAPDKKSALWHKAVDLARKVNRLGFTAVNGNEQLLKRQYSLSFNSFSVEKK